MAVEGSITLNELTVAEVDADPSVSGVDLPIGSLATLGDGVTGRCWVKTGPLGTDWTDLAFFLTASAVGLSATTTNTEGAATTLARSNHTHAIATGVVSTQLPDQANATGTGANLARANHTHNIPTGIASTIGTTNAQGSANAFARQDHIHDHGNQTTPTHHAAVTITDNGFMSSQDKVKLDRFATGFLQYQNSANQSTTSTTYGDVTLNENLNSFPNGFFTKVNTTDFRADFTGRVELSYSVSIAETGNNRGATVRVLQNGNLVPGSERTNIGASATNHGTVSNNLIIPVTSGDIFQLQFRTTNGGQSSTIQADRGLMLIKVYTLGLT